MGVYSVFRFSPGPSVGFAALSPSFRDGTIAVVETTTASAKAVQMSSDAEGSRMSSKLLLGILAMAWAVL